MNESMQKFDTGATRSADTGKPDPEGFFSPLALHAYMQYMHKHRHQADGTMRASDNWQRGIPLNNYMKSLWRHAFDVWAHHRGLPEITVENQVESLCAVIFNAMGYLHELLKAQRQTVPDQLAEQATFTQIEAEHIRYFLLNATTAGTYNITDRMRHYLETQWWADKLYEHFTRIPQEPTGEGESAAFVYSPKNNPLVYFA